EQAVRWKLNARRVLETVHRRTVRDDLIRNRHGRVRSLIETIAVQGYAPQTAAREPQLVLLELRLVEADDNHRVGLDGRMRAAIGEDAAEIVDVEHVDAIAAQRRLPSPQCNRVTEEPIEIAAGAAADRLPVDEQFRQPIAVVAPPPSRQPARS